MQIWVDAEGFPARASEGADVMEPELTLSRFQEELLRLTTGADEAFAARLYGELVAHAQGIREVWDLARTAPLLFSIEEGEGEQRR
jgi:hypothetical protein